MINYKASKVNRSNSRIPDNLQHQLSMLKLATKRTVIDNINNYSHIAPTKLLSSAKQSNPIELVAVLQPELDGLGAYYRRSLLVGTSRCHDTLKDSRKV